MSMERGFQTVVMGQEENSSALFFQQHYQTPQRRNNPRASETYTQSTVIFRSILLFKLMFKISPTITFFILFLFDGIDLQLRNLGVVLLELRSGCDIVPLFIYKFSISMVASDATVTKELESSTIYSIRSREASELELPCDACSDEEKKVKLESDDCWERIETSELEKDFAAAAKYMLRINENWKVEAGNQAAIVQDTSSFTDNFGANLHKKGGL